MFSLTRATQALIVANVLFYLTEAIFGSDTVSTLALWPIGPNFGFCRISGAWLRKATSLTIFSNSEAVELVGCGHG